MRAGMGNVGPLAVIIRTPKIIAFAWNEASVCLMTEHF
jgi:hypothetical protein